MINIIENTENSGVYYYIKSGMNGNSIIHFAYLGNKLIKHSSDFFYLRNSEKNKCINTFKKISNSNMEHIVINENVVNFITSFSRGTVHGYASVWELIKYYLDNKLTSKVLVYKKSQQGIIDIISHVIGQHNIIFIDSNIKYYIKNIIFIPLTQMHFTDIFWSNAIEPIFVKYIINNNNNNFKNNIAIIKSNKSDNKTNTGTIPVSMIKTICKNNNYTNIEPNNINEIDTANLLWNCKNFITSWGTSYYKNIRYIGNKCEKIYVLIPPSFRSQYMDRKNRPNSHTYIKYKNADVKYIMIDNLKKLENIKF